VELLDRQAKHWRGLEYGWAYMTMPTGLFLRDGDPTPLGPRTSGDIFFLYGEYARRARVGRREGIRPARGRLGPVAQRRIEFERGQRTKAEGGRKIVRRRGRVEGIKGRHFLENAWNEVVGTDGQQIVARYDKRINEIFAEYRRG
jgi:hypothetical protein